MNWRTKTALLRCIRSRCTGDGTLASTLNSSERRAWDLADEGAPAEGTQAEAIREGEAEDTREAVAAIRAVADNRIPTGSRTRSASLRQMTLLSSIRCWTSSEPSSR